MEISSVISEAHSQNIVCVSYNPYQHRLFTGSDDSTIKVWDIDTGKCERTLVRHTGPITDLFYCDRYNFLFSCSMDGTIVAWTALMKFFYEKKLNTPCACLAWDSKRKTLIAGMKNMIYFYRVNKNRTDATTMTLLDNLFCVELSGFVRSIMCADGKLVAGSFDRSITVIESATGRKTLKIPAAHKAAVSVVAYDEDNNRFITGGFDKKVKIWNFDGTIVFEIGGFSDVITGICYNPITKTIWVAANSTKPQIFDPITGQNLTELSGLTIPSGGGLQQVKFIPFTGEIIGTSSLNRSVIRWRHNPYTPVTTISSNEIIETITHSPRRRGAEIFTGSSTGVVRRWEFNGLDSQIQGHETYTGHTAAVLIMHYYEPLDVLITGSADKNIRIFAYEALPRRYENSNSLSRFPSVQKTNENWLKITGLDHVYVLSGHNDRISSLVCFRSGERHFIISVSWDALIIIWEINKESNHILKTIYEAHNDYIVDVDYSPERNEFITCSVDSTVKIWSFATFQCVGQLYGHQTEVTKILWDSSSYSWITTAHDCTIRLWNTNFQQTHLLRTPAPVTAICLDLNLGYVVVGCSDHKIRVYDTKRDIMVQENAGHSDVITSILHIKDCQQYVSTSWDQTIRVWAAPKDRDSYLLRNSSVLSSSYGDESPPLTPEGDGKHPHGESGFEVMLKNMGDTTKKKRRNSTSNDYSSPLAHLQPSGSMTIEDTEMLSRFKTRSSQKTIEFLRTSWRSQTPNSERTLPKSFSSSSSMKMPDLKDLKEKNIRKKRANSKDSNSEIQPSWKESEL